MSRLPPCPFCSGWLAEAGNVVGCLHCSRIMTRHFLAELTILASVATDGVDYSHPSSGEAPMLKTERLLDRRWRATLGSIDAVRPTKTEAVEAAQALAAEALAGDYTPSVVEYDGRQAIVYRDPVAGWCYVLDRITVAGSQARQDMAASAAMHLAQMAYPSRNGLDILVDFPSRLLDHCRWLAFQRAYAHKSGAGANDTQAYAFASALCSVRCWLTMDERDAMDLAKLKLAESRS